MGKVIAVIIWFGLGMIGFAAENAVYQAGEHEYNPGCWAPGFEWRHTRQELKYMFGAVFGPVYFIVALVDTGAFSHGFTFNIGVTLRCGRR